MEETKLIKLLDLALERIEDLESAKVLENDENYEIIERENEEYRCIIEEKNERIEELQKCFDRTIADVRELSKENEKLKTTNAEFLKRLEEAAEANDRLACDLSNSEVFIELRNENEKLSNMIRMLKTDKGILEDKLEELAKNSGESTPAKWCDILDATKRPRTNEQVLFTTQSGRVLVGSMDEDGKVHTAGKPVKVTAWMKLPKPFAK